MSEAFSKSVKEKLRELIIEAHEKALRQALEELGTHFDRWRLGKIDATDLVDFIHEFDKGPSREIYKRFTWSSYNDLPKLVAAAIRDGLLDEKTIPEDVMEAGVGRWLAGIRLSEETTTS
jgi:hypothetical protein